MTAAGDYSERVRALFGALQHAGDAGGPRVDIKRGGLQVQLSAALDGKRIRDLRFRAFACPHLLAALEDFCDEFEGRPAADLRQYEVSATLEKLAIPVAKTGRILLLEDAILALHDKIMASATTD
jgi:NifU-like protein involved in Fe-S cluster formation